MRQRLPDTRTSITHKFSIEGHEGYITVGLYDDGTPGEIFLTMAKEGSTISGLMDAFATSISLTLQYGVPLRDLVQKFSHMRFEPMGRTENREIPVAQSIVDYIFRWLASQFLADEDKRDLGILTDAERARLEAQYDGVQPELVQAPVQPIADVLPLLPRRRRGDHGRRITESTSVSYRGPARPGRTRRPAPAAAGSCRAPAPATAAKTAAARRGAVSDLVFSCRRSLPRHRRHPSLAAPVPSGRRPFLPWRRPEPGFQPRNVVVRRILRCAIADVQEAA